MPVSYGNSSFTILSPEYFECLDRYEPSHELLSVVEAHTDAEWEVRPRGFWSHCTPTGVTPARQGWKIHISAIDRTSRETLQRVLPLLIEGKVPFKFCSDRRMLRISTGKNWPRTASGKFITVYPQDEAQFTRLIEGLHQATSDLRGPYVLSDRPYKDSRVVFYRYGEHLGSGRISASGQRVPSIRRPDGTWVSDSRKPFFSLPDWVHDPFGGDAAAGAAEEPGEIVLNDRYRVTGALRYSSNGGLYQAVDIRTGDDVIIREARPMLSVRGAATDALSLLEKEARILQRLGDTGYGPAFVDLFGEWEHLFLVQEKLDAETLWMYAITSWARGFSPTLVPPPSELFEVIRRTVRALVLGLQAVHDRGIVLRDLTKSNVLVTRDHQVKFIDFEFAYEQDRDDPALPGWTPGYASPQQQAIEHPAVEDDHYALGALILDVLSFNASALPLNRRGALATLGMVLDDLGLPQVLRDVVIGLTDPAPDRRWRPGRVLQALDDVRDLPSVRTVDFAHDAPPPRPAPTTALQAEVESTLDGITRYVLDAADFSRTDRLWPASPEVFTTNPLGIQFGAAGIAYFLKRVTGDVFDAVLTWIRDGRRAHACPPSLYNGTSGIALLLLDLGREEEAKQMMAASDDCELIAEDPGLYYGAAGWGLANLHFWRATAEARYLDAACTTADRLLQTARPHESGMFWEHDGTVDFGLGHGQSGIATFLLYLHAARPDEAFLSAAEKALDFELAHAQRRDNVIMWFQHHGITGGPRLPYARYGTAGFGAAALRLYATTGELRFRRVADECAHTVATRHANKLWQDYGLAGFGEFLLDMYRFLGDENYLHNAYHVATGILPNRIVRPAGFAFAGVDQLRISCDVGMGSAGIGLFLHRLLNPRLPRFLFPDEMLTAQPAGGADATLGSRADAGVIQVAV